MHTRLLLLLGIFFLNISFIYSQSTNNTENNDSQLRALPDIIVEDPDAEPTTIAAGDKIDLSCVIKNQGGASTGPGFGFKYYLSTDENFGIEDGDVDLLQNPIFVGELEAGETFNLTTSEVEIPENTTLGTYFIVFFADSEFNVNESNENNNTNFKKIIVTGSCLDVLEPNGDYEEAFDIGEATFYENDEVCLPSESDQDWYKFTFNNTPFFFKVIETPQYQGFGLGPYKINFSRSDNDVTMFTSPTGGIVDTYLEFYGPDHITLLAFDEDGQGQPWFSQIDYSINIPDLLITDETVNPGTLEAGASTILNFKVENQATAENAFAGTNKVGFYLSDNQTFEETDVFLTDYEITEYLNSETATDYLTQNITIPEGTEAGTYYILFKADYEENLDETDEDNNVVFQEITVASCGDPLEPNNNFIQAVTITDGTMHDDLCLIPEDEDWFKFDYNGDTYYFSVLGAEVDVEGDYNLSFSLTDDEVTIETSSRNSSTTDTYLELYNTDGESLLDEDDNSGTDANFSKIVYSLTNPLPDLTALHISLGSPSAQAGADFTVSYTVKNVGEATAGTSKVGYYLSTNDSFEPEFDLELGDLTDISSLDHGDSVNIENNTRTIPVDTELGTYYIIVVADDDLNEVIESDETNNWVAHEFNVVDCDPFDPNSNLGDAFDLGDENLSVTTTCLSDEFDEDFFKFSYFGSYYYFKVQYPLIFETPPDNNPYGIQFTRNGSQITIQTSDVGGTNFGVHLTLYDIDGETIITEVTNFQWATQIVETLPEPLPDLIIDGHSVTPTEDIEAGAIITANCTVKNRGQGDASASKLGFYLSAVSGGLDIELEEKDVVALAADETDEIFNVSLVIPDDTPAGDYNIIYKADNNDNIDENIENNNTASDAITIIESNCEDITEPNDSGAEANSDIGNSSAYAFNNLCLTATDQDWFSFIYSNKTYFYKVRGESDVTSGAYSLSFSRVGNTVTIQTLSSEGSSTDTYLELYDSDTTTLINENDDGGNAPFSTLTHDLTIPLPDLTVLNSDNISSVKTGEEITLTVDVKNIAEANAESTSKVGYYLSTDEILDEDTDVFLGDLDVEALNANQAINKGLTVSIPFETAPGDYFVIYVADLLDDIEEDNEENNTLNKSMSVTLSTITIITPNGNDNLTVGNTQSIVWTTDTDGDVSIELLKNGELHELIAETTPNDGSFSWNVFTSLQTISNDYKIKITSLEDENVTDESDETFTIEPNIITLTAPNGGESYNAGDAILIEWNSLLSENAKIELYKGGAFLQDIIASTDNDGSYEWNTNLTMVTGSDFKIKITTIDDIITKSDMSNEDFSITPPPVSTVDSLALIALYNNTSGENWATSWNLTDEIRDWNGVGLLGNRVTEVSLEGQNLIGTIPSELKDLALLETLNLADNQLSGLFPEEITNIATLNNLNISKNQLTAVPVFDPGLSYLNVAENILDFSDVLPNIAISNAGGTYIYSPQANIDSEIETTIVGGDSYTMTVSEETAGNTYQWKKDDVNINDATLVSYILNNFQKEEAGVYTCSISNPGAPDLTIERNAITISHENASPNDIALNDAMISENLSVGSEVGEIVTTDPDLSDNHSYELIVGDGDDDNVSFQIAENKLQSTEVFDFEVKETYSVRIKTTDQDGASFEKVFVITVSDENDQPTFENAIADQQATEDAAFSFTFDANVFADEDDGDVLTYSATLSDDTELPSWLNFDNDTRTFSGTPENDHVGTIIIKLKATDEGDASATDEFELEVINTNDTPTVLNAIADQTADEDANFNFTFAENTFEDVDVDDVLSYSASLSDDTDLPDWLSFDGESRTFSGTPTQDELGTITIKVTATDNSDEKVSDEFDIEVVNTNDDPIVVNPISDQEATEDAAFAFSFDSDVFDDVDPSDELSYSATLSDNSELPSWLSFDADTRTFSGTPENDDVGTIIIKVIAKDIADAEASDEFNLEVINTNDAPELANPITNQTADEDADFNFTFAENTFNDIDVADVLSYTATLTDDSDLPSWLSFDGASRTFSGIPTQDDLGTISVKVTAKDNSDESVTDEFDIEVVNTNDAPIVENPISDQQATEDAAFSFTFDTDVFTDVDPGDALSYSASLTDNSDLPSWLSFDADTRTFSGTPENSDVGTITLKVIAKDIAEVEVTDEFDLEVINTNDPPTLLNPVSNQTADEDADFNFTFAENTFNDIDVEDVLTYTATLTDDSELPSWLSFDGESRTFSGIPTQDELGTISIKITAKDISEESVTDEFDLEVVNTNDAPVVENPVSDQQATEDLAFSFTFDANVFNDVDPDDELTYTATLSDNTELPAWLSFDADTRTFSGTPENDDVGTITVKLIATDKAGADISDEFDLEVINTNDAPTLINEIANQTANEDEEFSFTFAENTFNDIDVGDVFTYQATLSDDSSLPTWLSFDADNRTFSGTPSQDFLGTITIKVTANDSGDESISDEFELEVLNTNDDPIVQNPLADQEATEDVAFTYTFDVNSFSDIDPDDELSYTATLSDNSDLPSWLSFDAESRTFSGTPENQDVGTITVKVTAIDKAGANISDQFDLEVINTNDTPTLENPIANQTVNEDDLLDFTFDSDVFNDVDAGDVLTYVATLSDDSELPSWLSFDADTRTFSGIPLNENVGTITLKVKVTDLADANISDEFDLEVINTNDIPTLENPISNQTVNEDDAFLFTFNQNVFNDVDAADVLTYSATLSDDSDLPSWLTFDPDTRTFSGTPENDHVGTISIKVTATDIALTSVSDEFDLEVFNTNDIPTLENPIVNQETNEDAEFSFTFDENTFNDVDLGDVLTYNATLSDDSDLPSWLTFDAGTRTLSGTPENDHVGVITIKITAKDNSEEQVTDEFDIEVINTNDAPVLVSGLNDQEATEDLLFSFTFVETTFNDIDVGDVLSYTATLSDDSELPTWLTLDSDNRTFSGTPLNEHVGSINVKLIASDIAGAKVSTEFSITVENTNDTPTLENPIGNLEATEDQIFTYVFASDVFNEIDEEDELTFTATLNDGNALPEWLGFTGESRTFAGLPENDDVGSFDIKLIATDKIGASVSDQFRLEVINTNDTPTLVNPITNQTATEDAGFSYTFNEDVFNDVDAGDVLSYQATLSDDSALPSWLSFDGSNRTFSGTPENGDVGSLTIKITAYDSENASVTDEFELIVENTNDTPIIANPLIDQNADEDAAFSYTFDENTFTDPDVGDELTYSSTLADDTELPSWLSFDADNRTLSGTPENDHVGSIEVKVTATDLEGASASDNFILEIANTNDAPEFTSVKVLGALQDVVYEYNVSAEDVDAGASLTLSAPTLPTWLSFTDNGSGTGLLTGTPTNAEVGKHDVVLAVSDGIADQVLQSFTITVSDVNDAPEFTSLAFTIATEEEPYEYNITASDIDGNESLTISSSSLPSWLDLIDEGNGIALLSGIPGNDEVGTHDISLILSDGIADPVLQEFTITVINTNDAPTLENPIADQVATEDAHFEFTFDENTFNDIDIEDELTYTATLSDESDLPNWLTFEASERKFTGTPLNDNVGAINIVVTATDTEGESVTDQFEIEIENTNDAPYLVSSIDDQTATEEVEFNFTFDNGTFEDDDLNDELTYSASLSDESDLPEWLTFVASTRTFSGTPLNEDVGAISIKITAIDNSGATANTSFELEVLNVNNPPVIVNPIVDQTANEDALFTFTIDENVFADPDEGDMLIYSAAEILGQDLPDWLSFDPETRTFTGTPSNDDVGPEPIRVTATDQAGAFVSDIFIIDILNTNDPPEFTSVPVLGALQETLYSYVISAEDVDQGAILSFNANVLPEWLNFTDNHNGTALLSGTPTNDEVGDHNVVISVNDGIAEGVLQSFTIKVANSNDAPEFTSTAPLTVEEDDNYVYNITANDIDGNESLTISSSDLPSWLSINDLGNGEAVLSGTPTNDHLGDHQITLDLNDGIAETVEQSFTVSVSNVNDAPILDITIVSQQATEDELFSFVIDENTFIDIDPDDELTYSVSLIEDEPLPVWLSFNATTRTLEGTPENSDVTTLQIEVKATDLSGAFATTEFSLEVINSNDIPFVSNLIEDQITNEDDLFTFNIVASIFGDDDIINGDILSYSAVGLEGENLPEWLSFDSETNTLSGTPENSEVGTFGVRIIAEDTEGETTFDEFMIQVLNVNDAPTVLNPITNQFGQENAVFDFTFDEDVFGDIDEGDQLSFTTQLSNGNILPDWLNFNPETRNFSGTPLEEHVTTIRIRVIATDLEGASVSNEFDLEVLPNNPPELINPIVDQVIAEDLDFLYQFPFNTFSDQDDEDVLSYNATLSDDSALPLWITFNGEDRIFSGTPSNSDVGSIDIKVTATDRSGDSVSDIFSLEVINVNDAPVFTSEDVNEVLEDDAYFYLLTFSDIDNPDEDLSVSTTFLPTWLTLVNLNDGSAELKGTPTNDDVGEYQIKIDLTDGEWVVSKEFMLKVININDAPVLSSITLSGFCPDVSSSVDLSDYTTDIDNDVNNEIIYNLDKSNVPSGFEIFLEGSVLEITNNSGVAAIFDISVSVEDPEGLSDQQIVSITTYSGSVSITNESNVLVSTEADTYQWYKDGDAIQDATQQAYEIDETGEYFVRVTYANGQCAAESEVLSIENVVPLEISLYPNPSSDYITLESNTLENNEVFIINSNGGFIPPSIVSSNKIDIRNLTRGIYTLRIVNETGKVAVTRFFKY